MRLKLWLNIRKGFCQDDARIAPSFLELPTQRREQAEIIQYAWPQFFCNAALQLDCLLERSLHSVHAIQRILTKRRLNAAHRIEIHDRCSHYYAKFVMQLVR